MGIEFLQQNAPEWITPEPQAGLAPDTPLYERGTNTPLPYIQDAGGPRSYLSMTGSASYAPQEGAPQAPIQATTSAAPPPLSPGAGPIDLRPSNRVQIPMELRPRTDETPRGPGLDRPGLDLPASAYPTDVQAPRDILAPPAAGRMGEAPVVGIPPADGRVIGLEVGRRGEQLRHGGEAPVIGVPPANGRVAGTEAGRAAGGSTTPTPQTQGPARNNRMQPTDMRIQDLFTRPGATLRDMIHATGGRFDWAGARQEQPWTPEPEVTTTDRRASTGSVQRTSSNLMGPDFSTPEGLAEFNRVMGLELGTQVRTQAEQDDLYNRGLTPTRNSAHIHGAAFDWPGSRLNGLSGRDAVNHVRTRMVAEYGEDVANNFTYKWETGSGRNQGTGPHVHAQRRRQ